jgi:V/A-type H+-transporting ATPase subunit K
VEGIKKKESISMYSVLILGSAIIAVICVGFYLRSHSVSGSKAKRVLTGAMVFLFAMLCLSSIPVFAAETAGEASGASSAAGLGYLGASLATGLACVGAGIAVGYVGAAALGVVGEKPAMLGTTLIYLGLAEGIAIYGIIVSLLILGRL